MAETLRPDLCVVGAGAGGVAAAYAAAAIGASVVLVDKRRLEDGRPNKALITHVLIEAARTAAAWQSSTSAGQSQFEPAPFKSVVDIAALRTRAQTLASQLALDTPIRLAALRIKTIEGKARFTGRKSCEAGGFTIEPKWFVVAPGAVPAPMKNMKDGHVKLVTYARDRLFGAGIVGPQARELIGVYGLALSQGLRVSDLKGFVPGTPSLAEAGSLAALALPGQLGKALWRRMFPVPRRFR
jgi:pyruvate/2-oxoglutarate dehydrogenase complex dihydrolipoamide dehydrogenase (E3) component